MIAERADSPGWVQELHLAQFSALLRREAEDAADDTDNNVEKRTAEKEETSFNNEEPLENLNLILLAEGRGTYLAYLHEYGNVAQRNLKVMSNFAVTGFERRPFRDLWGAREVAFWKAT